MITENYDVTQAQTSHHIGPLSLARDDGFVGDGFVGIAGQSSGDPIASDTDCQTYPTEVDPPFDGELETKVAVLYTR